MVLQVSFIMWDKESCPSSLSFYYSRFLQFSNSLLAARLAALTVQILSLGNMLLIFQIKSLLFKVIIQVLIQASMKLNQKKNQSASLHFSQSSSPMNSSKKLGLATPLPFTNRRSLKVQSTKEKCTNPRYSIKNDKLEEICFLEQKDVSSIKSHRRIDSFSIFSSTSNEKNRRQQNNFFQFSNLGKKTFNPEEKKKVNEKMLSPNPNNNLSHSNNYKSENSCFPIGKHFAAKREPDIRIQRKQKIKQRDVMIGNLQKKLEQFRELVIQVKNLSENETNLSSSVKYSQETIKASKLDRINRIKDKKVETGRRISLKDFHILGCKGKGRFGEVKVALHKSTGMIVALKVQKKAEILRNHWMQRFISEVKIQYFLNHSNIVKLYGFFDDCQNVYMVMEYMNEGNLYSSLKKRKKLNEVQGSQAIYNILCGVTQLHNNCIIHRDIKPENIVICMGVYKLCDFGWSVVENGRRLTYCGTFDYAPPEILKGEQYNYSIDLWEVGIVSYEILFGCLPFFHPSKRQTFHQITNYENSLNFPNNTTQEAINFIKKLLRKKPEERTPAAELLRHLLFKKNKNQW